MTSGRNQEDLKSRTKMAERWEDFLNTENYQKQEMDSSDDELVPIRRWRMIYQLKDQMLSKRSATKGSKNQACSSNGGAKDKILAQQDFPIPELSDFNGIAEDELCSENLEDAASFIQVGLDDVEFMGKSGYGLPFENLLQYLCDTSEVFQQTVKEEVKEEPSAEEVLRKFLEEGREVTYDAPPGSIMEVDSDSDEDGIKTEDLTLAFFT